MCSILLDGLNWMPAGLRPTMPCSAWHCTVTLLLSDIAPDDLLQVREASVPVAAATSGNWVPHHFTAYKGSTTQQQQGDHSVP